MSIFGLLKRKPKFEEPIIEKNNKTMEINDTSKPDPIMQMMASIPDSSSESALKTYDIIVYEPQPDGTKKQSTVNGVKARSPKDLARLYAADGAQIQILKEYGGGDSIQSNVTGAGAKSMQAQPYAQPSINQQRDVLQQTHPRPPIQFPQHQNEPPKFFEIGGVKCKLENGKMYQEQWVRVDSTKYRLIADASNKIVPMTNKHLETLKWVQIENKDGETENA